MTICASRMRAGEAMGPVETSTNAGICQELCIAISIAI
jgi:hypothetical protein